MYRRELGQVPNENQRVISSVCSAVDLLCDFVKASSSSGSSIFLGVFASERSDACVVYLYTHGLDEMGRLNSQHLSPRFVPILI